MPRLLLLLPTTTYRAEAYLGAANCLKLDVTVGGKQAFASASEAAGNFLLLNFDHPHQYVQAAAAFAQHYPIDAVIGVDDLTAVAAAAIADQLALPHNSVASVAAAGNKFRMRELLSAQGVPVPRYQIFPVDGDPADRAKQVTYPCVVKPLILSASCGVIRADDETEYAVAFRRVVALLSTLGLTAGDEQARWILAEDFVAGPEVALEGLLTNGVLQPLAIFDKPDPLDGPFFEETIYVTPSRLPSDLQQAIVECARRAARALGLQEGPVHGEFRVNDKGVWVIELAARTIGGRCSRALAFTAGMSLEELILRHALRMPLPPLTREDEAAGVMMLPIPYSGVLNEVRGQDEARAVPGITELTITALHGQALVPLPEGGRYLGFLLARGRTAADVESALREAHRRLTVVITASPSAPTGAPGTSSGIRAMSF